MPGTDAPVTNPIPAVEASAMSQDKPFGSDYIMGGKVVISKENFCLKIWSKRELTDAEILQAFDAWRAGQPMDFSRKDQTLDFLTDIA